jgi:hypothetical protein
MTDDLVTKVRAAQAAEAEKRTFSVLHPPFLVDRTTESGASRVHFCGLGLSSGAEAEKKHQAEQDALKDKMREKWCAIQPLAWSLLCRRFC